MDLVTIYECLCDKTRLRLLHLLLDGPLCVCHFQAALREPQVKVSKHLGYLKRNGLVQAERVGNWVIYRLPAKPSPQLRVNLACLQDSVREDRIYREDARRCRKLRKSLGHEYPAAVRRPSGAGFLLTSAATSSVSP